jgi:uncharacterized membrane protein
MGLVRVVKGFFAGFRESAAAQREIEGRTKELFRWIAFLVILAVILSVFAWFVISMIQMKVLS